MDEFSFINSIQQSFYRQSSLIKGIGDDAAVFRQPSEDIVTAVDTFVEGIHFTRETMPPYYIGYRVLAANLSDLAAMGAVPAFYLVSIIIPDSWETKKIQKIFYGMKSLSQQFKLDLIGGDTVSGEELSISLTVIGYVKREKARYRSLARPGDIVFVTGTLGDSQAGLHILMNNGQYKDHDYFVKRHRMPTPRIRLVESLFDINRMSLNDISDGIISEAAEIANESQVNIVLDADKIPTSRNFDQFPLHLQKKWKYYGGEDFELLGTVPEKDWKTIQEFAIQADIKVTEVGYVEHMNGKSQVFLKEGMKEKVPLFNRGYVHLK